MKHQLPGQSLEDRMRNILWKLPDKARPGSRKPLHKAVRDCFGEVLQQPPRKSG